MAADTQDSKLSKVDSAVADGPASPSDIKEKKDRRSSSTASNVFNIADLGMSHVVAERWRRKCKVDMSEADQTHQRRRMPRSRSHLKHRDSTGGYLYIVDIFNCQLTNSL